MYLIDGLLARVEAFNTKLEDGTFMSKIVKDYEADIVEMNSQSQLYKGLDCLGVEISSYQPYKPLTIQIKQMKWQPYDRVTLRDEGDFYAGFFLRIDNECFEITSEDWKADMLVKKYGYQIFGLTAENQSILAHDYIYPELLEIAYRDL